MSRVSYSEDEDYPGQFELWNANLGRSLSGRRGQASLRELEEALLALPRKRLVSHIVACEGEVCAVGALLALRRAKADGSDVATAIDALETDLGDRETQADDYTPDRGESAGMPRLVAWKVVALNDIEIDGRYVDCEGPLREHHAWQYGQYGYRGVRQWLEHTPEERYERVLAWVRSQIAVG